MISEDALLRSLDTGSLAGESLVTTLLVSPGVLYDWVSRHRPTFGACRGCADDGHDVPSETCPLRPWAEWASAERARRTGQ